MSDEQVKKISRRELLKSAGTLGAAVALPGSLSRAPEPGEGAALRRGDQVGAAPRSRALPVVAQAQPRIANLTVEEAEILDAMVARLIPADDLGPGAREAGATYYIDRELGGALASTREAYRAGLAALDRYARYSRGARFAELGVADQDSVLVDVQTGAATGAGAGFQGSSASFFRTVRSHTWQGTFGDPQYGGNQDFVGWDLIRYPGVRRVVSARDQQLLEEGRLSPNHLSAYDQP